MKKKAVAVAVSAGELPELGHKSREIEEARRLISKAALPATHASVANYARLAFRAVAKRMPKGDESLGVSASKWGGAPDLPADAAVPPLALIAQVNLARLPTQALAHAGVPTGGLLSFFYDLERQPSGLVPSDGPLGSSVIYTPSSASFVRLPAGQSKGLRPCELVVRAELTIPAAESSDYQAVCDGKDLDAAAAYLHLLQAIEAVSGGVSHRLLGHPTPVQGNLQLAAELVSRGLDAGSPKSYQGLASDVLAKSRRWRLLLQVDSATEIEWSWGDAGRLYFLIPEEDLREMRFDRVRAIQQGH